MNASYCLLILKRILLLTGLLIIAASTAAAKAPEPPTLGVTVSSTLIHLEWKPSQTGDPATVYRVYQSKPNDPSGSTGSYTQIGTTEKTIFEISNPATGIYLFYVTAYNADGESQASNPVKANVDGQPDPTTTIKFITEPNRDATVGSLYQYKAQAIAPNGEKVLYKVTQAPLGAAIPYAEGITINRETGVVAWMPKTQGTFAAAIIAYLASDSTMNAMQVLIISVKAPACAMIRGTVRDSSGVPIENAWITAVSADGSTGADWSTSASSEVVKGEYSLPVSPGTYVLYLKHPQLGAIWYKNAFDISGAEHLTVSCNDTLQADFSVTAAPAPKPFTVSGRVTAKSDGHGVQATVQFLVLDKKGRTPDPGTGVVSPSGIVAMTDADGNYSVELSDEFGYIAQAVPDGDELLPQYYNGVSTPTEATLITPTTAKGMINFFLVSRPVYNNSIAGNVKDEAGAVIASQVIAIRIPDGSNTPDPSTPLTNEFARSTTTSSDGTFMLKNLVPGDYVLLAIPNNRDYVPGYFLAGGMSVRVWKNATRISMDETMESMMNDIILDRRDGVKGFAKLSGYVKVAPNGTRSKDNMILGPDALPGVFVFALDPNGRVSDYIFSDPSGWFELNELGAADYQIVADKVGYITQVITTTLDYDGHTSVEKDLAMGRATSSVNEKGATDGIFSIYPNPANSQLTLQFNVNIGKASLTIVNALGQTVYTASINAVTGTNRVAIDISTFGAGSYRAQLQSNGMNISVPFAVVR